MSSEAQTTHWAIRAQGVGKTYRLYDKPHHRLLQSLWRGRKSYYREFAALHNISFELERGQTLGIIGRNGAGKSTLLQIICGTLHPSAGNVQVRGRIAALLELGTGFNPEFTGRENIAINAAILGLSQREISERLDDIIAFAVCRALLRHPVMNSTLREDGIHLHKHVNLGMAVSLDTGLIVPNVKNADTFSLEQLKEKVRDAASRARKGGLSMDEISGGTFTISNVSMLGVDGFTPILNPPETGILGVGRVVEKPGVFEGEVCVRKMMTLSLTFNHMVTDGGPAMSFLRTLADMLEKPVRMLG